MISIKIALTLKLTLQMAMVKLELFQTASGSKLKRYPQKEYPRLTYVSQFILLRTTSQNKTPDVSKQNCTSERGIKFLPGRHLITA